MDDNNKQKLRACQQCNRKKTRCDMKRPACGLCLRTGSACSFPPIRKVPLPKPHHEKAKLSKVAANLDRLVQLLDPQTPEHEPFAFPTSTESIITTDLYSRNEMLYHAPPDHRQASTSAIGTLAAGSSEAVCSVSNVSVAGSNDEFVSYAIAVHLIDLFFDCVQPCATLLHKPVFMRYCQTSLELGSNALAHLENDEKCLFYSIFSLSARFSDSPHLIQVPAPDRGHNFAQLAKKYQTASENTIPSASMKLLQGCILLAFYMYSSGLSPEGWVMVGSCVRLAHVLEVSDVDNEDENMSGLTWVEREEQRRAWWVLFEMDSYGSASAYLPHATNPNRMSVKLPVSDELWYAGTETSSAPIDPRPGMCWKSLTGVENQCERAWFLITVFFIHKIGDLALPRSGVTREDAMVVDNEISCFRLALPSQFNLELIPATCDTTAVPKINWVIGTHLLLSTAMFLASALSAGTTDTFDSLSTAPSEEVRSFVHDVYLVRTVRKWPAECLAMAPPFFVGCFPPMHGLRNDPECSAPATASSVQLLELVQVRFAERWKLGSAIIRVSQLLKKAEPLTHEELQFIKQYAIHFSQHKGSAAQRNLKGKGGSNQAGNELDRNTLRFEAADLRPLDESLLDELNSDYNEFNASLGSFIPADDAYIPLG